MKMQWILSLVLLLMLSVFMSGCGSSSPAASSGGTGGGPVLPTYYVNAATGADTNAGTLAAPFKTITKALNTASVSGGTINVATGTYNVANGEVFPLKLFNNVNLIGDIANKGVGAASTTITGGALYTPTGGSVPGNGGTAIVFPPGVTASFSGFNITGCTAPIVADNASGATITSNTILSTSMIWTVIIANKSAATITSNNISSGYMSVVIVDASTTATLRGNTISTNGAGIIADVYIAASAGPVDLGTAASPGNNTILGSTGNVGLYAGGVGVVQAVGNTWKPNVQGADAAGHYAAQFAPNGVNTNGNNYFAGPGGIQF